MPCSRDGTFVFREANRLLSASRCWTRSNVSSSTRAGTGIPVHSSRGRSCDPDLPGDGAAGEAGGAVQPGRLVDGLGLAEDRGAGVGGVAEHAPDHRPVPPFLAGAGAHALVRQPAAQVRDGRAVVGVAAEHLGHQGGLVRDHLVAGTGLGGLADVAVAERGAGQHVDAAGSSPARPCRAGTARSAGPSRTRRTCPGTGPAAGPRGCRRAAPSRTRPGSRSGRAPRSAAPGRRTCGPAGPASRPAPRRGSPGRPGRAAPPGPAGPASRRSAPRRRRPSLPGRQAGSDAACSRRAASWEPIVSSFACRALETLA